MTTPVHQSAVAGWYPDTAHAGMLRYFDGTQWTGHTTPMTAPVQYQPPSVGSSPSDPVHWLLPIGRTWQSIAGGYVALFATLIWVLGPVAIWLGVAALRASARGKGHGRGRAYFSLIVGSLATVAMIIFLVSSL